MATAIMKQKEVPEMDDVAEIISKIRKYRNGSTNISATPDLSSQL